MNQAKLRLFLGPESNFKSMNINTYLNMEPEAYTISTKDVHDMFGMYKFNSDVYMDIAYRSVKNMIYSIHSQGIPVALVDWYFDYSKIEVLIGMSDNVEIFCYESPLDSYLKYRKDHIKFPDVLDVVKFYDNYKEFLESDLLERICMREGVRVRYPMPGSRAQAKKDFVM